MARSTPFSGSLPHRATAASCDTLSRILRTYRKTGYRLTDYTTGAPISETTILEMPFASLIRFNVEGHETKPPVLIAAALSGHHGTLLRDTVRGIARDFTPYITDWRDAKEVAAEAGSFDLDDYIEHLLRSIEAVGPGLHLVATCQSGPASLAAIAHLQKYNPALVPLSLTLMASPIDTRVNPGLINKITEYVPLWVFRKSNIDSVPMNHEGAGRRVYPGYVQLLAFTGLRALAHGEKYRGFFLDTLHNRDTSAFTDFYDEYNAVLDVTEAFYMDTLKRVFYEHHLATGRMTYRGESLDFSQVTVPLLTVEGARDELCPPGQTRAAAQVLLNSRHQHYEQEGADHMGVFVGPRFQTGIYPVIRDFINRCD